MVKIIAETAWHHEGDLVFMKELVSEICLKTRTNYIKLHIPQKHLPQLKILTI